MYAVPALVGDLFLDGGESMVNLVRLMSAIATVALVCTSAQANAPDQATSTKASVYSNKFAGKKTASGKTYKPGAMTAASKTLPLGSKAEVKNQKTGKKAVVTITDRGPHVKGRGIDLSKSAANKIGVKGVSNVKVKKVQ
jgi:rare lipoprotein A